MALDRWNEVKNEEADGAITEVLVGSDIEVVVEQSNCKIRSIILRNAKTGKRAMIAVNSYTVEVCVPNTRKEFSVSGAVGTAPFQSPWTNKESEAQELLDSLVENGAGAGLSVESREVNV